MEEIIHWVIGKLVNGVVEYRAACDVADPASCHWTTNRDLVTCWKCRQKA